MKVKLLVQIGIVFGICLVGEGIAAVLPFAFPASVLSMLLLFVLLLCGVLKVEHIREKGDFLLKNMAFFFIPSGVALLEQVDLPDYDGTDLCCHRFYRAVGQPLAEASEKVQWY